MLSPTLLSRLERLRLTGVRKTTARGHGEHLAGRGGLSTDFADYREYAAGDDLRFVDWNVYARLQRPYLKQFRIEEERHVVLVLDDSKSMSFGAKAAAASTLAAALSVCALHGDDRLSIWSGVGELLPPTRGRAGQRRALSALERLGTSGTTPIEAICTRAAASARRGLALVVSDMLSEGEVRKGLHRLASAGLEPQVIQVLDPAELDPDPAGDLRLVDSETGSTVDISSSGDVLALYHAARSALERDLINWTRALGGRALTLNAATPIAEVITNVLMRKGWLR
jgi:uncharacterized protein (DUF58 family)